MDAVLTELVRSAPALMIVCFVFARHVDRLHAFMMQMHVDHLAERHEHNKQIRALHAQLSRVNCPDCMPDGSGHTSSGERS